jgi:N-acetyl-gamma-glutamyl-phosphate reductase
MVRIAIIGASGYTGSESVEILMRHNQAEVTYLTALPQECGSAGEVFGKLKGRCGLDIEPLDMNKLADNADVVLCCLPHKVSMGFVPKLLDLGLKVIDFSADYRIKDVAVYEKFYQQHTDQANLANAVYGLPELFRDKITSDTKLIANPGCFPTGALLAIAPLLKNGLIKTESIIVSSVTGSSGAGKNPSTKFHFPNMNENLFAYGVGAHRHMPEMEQVAADIAGGDVNLLFQPHVGPFDRGILSSVYCEPAKAITNDELTALYSEFYSGERFVQLCTSSPQLKDVAGTNYCHVYPAVAKGRIVCFSAIDNLVKGASGQAIQNMNIMYGFDEAEGLL